MITRDEIDYSRVLTEDEIEKWRELFKNTDRSPKGLRKTFRRQMKNPFWVRFLVRMFVEEPPYIKRRKDQANQYYFGEFNAEASRIDVDLHLKEFPAKKDTKGFYSFQYQLSSKHVQFALDMTINPFDCSPWEIKLNSGWETIGRGRHNLTEPMQQLHRNALRWYFRQMTGIHLPENLSEDGMVFCDLEGIQNEEEVLKLLRSGEADLDLRARLAVPKQNPDHVTDYALDSSPVPFQGLSEGSVANYWSTLRTMWDYGYRESFKTFPRMIQLLGEFGQIRKVTRNEDSTLVHWKNPDYPDYDSIFEICKLSGILSFYFYLITKNEKPFSDHGVCATFQQCSFQGVYYKIESQNMPEDSRDDMRIIIESIVQEMPYLKDLEIRFEAWENDPWEDIPSDGFKAINIGI